MRQGNRFQEMFSGVDGFSHRPPLIFAGHHKHVTHKTEGPSDAHLNRIGGAWLGGANLHLVICVIANSCSLRIFVAQPDSGAQRLPRQTESPLSGTAREFVRKHDTFILRTPLKKSIHQGTVKTNVYPNKLKTLPHPLPQNNAFVNSSASKGRRSSMVSPIPI